MSSLYLRKPYLCLHKSGRGLPQGQGAELVSGFLVSLQVKQPGSLEEGCVLDKCTQSWVFLGIFGNQNLS